METVPVIHGPNGIHVKLSPTGKQVLNMAIPDWVGLVENDKMKEVALETLRNYGVGSCSPMGFYGTIGQSGVSYWKPRLSLQTCTSS